VLSKVNKAHILHELFTFLTIKLKKSIFLIKFFKLPPLTWKLVLGIHSAVSHDCYLSQDTGACAFS